MNSSNSQSQNMGTSNAFNNNLNNLSEAATMNQGLKFLQNAFRSAILYGVLMLTSYSGLLAQEATGSSTVASDKFSIGIESGMNFSSFTFDGTKADSTATGRGCYMAINGSYAISEQFGIQLSGGYEEVRWNTSQNHWTLPASPAVRDAFGLPDSVGTMTSLKQSTAVTMPQAAISAHVRFNPTPWLGLMAGGTVQFSAGDGTVQRTWQASDSTGRIPFKQTASFPVTDNIPSRRYAFDGQVVITPLRLEQIDFSIHTTYRIFLAEDYPQQNTSSTKSRSDTQMSTESLRQVGRATLTDMFRIGASLTYRF
jgi:hypothetical protein